MRRQQALARPRSQTFRYLLSSLLGLCLIVFSVESGWRNGWFDMPENYYQDLWARLTGQQFPVENTALVKLDEATLAQYPDVPLIFWGPQYARATAVLREVGAKVIAFDILFSSNPEQWLTRINGLSSPSARAFDQSFRQELASGKVIVAGMQNPEETLLPASDYLLSLPGVDIRRFVGAANLTPDSDGVLRNMYPLPPPVSGEGVSIISLPFLIAIHATNQSTDADNWLFGSRKFTGINAPRLAYAGPPGTVPSLSMHRLLSTHALQDPDIQALRGKVIIIGASYGGTNDLHLTPYGRGLFNSPLMLGAEIQAQMTEALLRGRFLDPVPSMMRLALPFLLLPLMFLLWSKLRLPGGLFILLLALSIVTGFGYAAFRAHWIFATAHLQICILLGFACIYGWRFTHGEKERERVRTLFSRYVESSVVNALLNADTMPELGGEQREMTILFSDIRNFTTISERLTPLEVVEMLNNYFGRACNVLMAEGGCIDKFIGDAIMAEFGIPLAAPDHAHRAIAAAIRLQKVAEDFGVWMQQRFAGRDLPPFAIGIGLHTGQAVAGNIGTTQRMEYTVIGDSVNLASRLESMTKELGCIILASQDTLLTTANAFLLGRSATITVKGRTQPVKVWEILGFSRCSKE